MWQAILQDTNSAHAHAHAHTGTQTERAHMHMYTQILLAPMFYSHIVQYKSTTEKDTTTSLLHSLSFLGLKLVVWQCM